MVSRRIPWRLLLLCSAVAATGPRDAAAQAVPDIAWRADYVAARKEAQEKGLPLVLDFGTKNCFWCKKLEDTTFRDPRVAAALNERFVPLKVDAEREVTLAQTLRIASYPTVVLASPDGRILGTMEGYQEADKFHDNLQRVLATLTPPDWVERDLKNATRWTAAGEYARAIPTLRSILEEPRARPQHPQAQKLMQEIEDKAKEHLASAKGLQEQGKLTEAIESLTETMRLFPGCEATRGASETLTLLVQNPDVRNQHRAKRARELLAQATDFYKNKEYIPCLDRCDVLLASYGDLHEATEATRLSSEIKNNPEWLQGACDTLSDRLGGLYLSLADSLLKRGQPQRAEFYLQRVIASFPGTRQAESAQIRLTQLQGVSPRPTQFQSAAQPTAGQKNN
jgi:thioredoxin-like negative regulator of GroEL